MSEEEPREGAPYDTSDKKAVAKAKSAAGRLRKADEEVIRKLLSTPMGRSWFWRLLEACHIWSTSFDPGNFDVTAFREGERNIGLRLLADAQRCPDLFLQMAREGNDREDLFLG